MFALDRDSYARWQEFSPTERYWIKFWLDGVHIGTHVHWSLSPLSVAGLALLWELFGELESWGVQKKAIKGLACLRARSTYLGVMPSWGDTPSNDEAWTRFFALQRDGLPEIRKRLLDHHRLLFDVSLADKRSLVVRAHELRSILTIDGYSTDDLFNRVKDGVLDPGRKKQESPTDRLRGLLDFLDHPTQRTYVVWTAVVRSTSSWSGALERRYSKVALRDPAEFRRADGNPLRVFLVRDDTKVPVVAQIVDGSNGTAERHRRVARSLLAATQGLGRLVLEDTTHMVLETQRRGRPWKYDYFAKRRLLPSADWGTAVSNAVGEIFDYPEGVIDAVFKEAEPVATVAPTPRRPKASTDFWWNRLSSAYHWSLRTDLAAMVRAYFHRTNGITDAERIDNDHEERREQRFPGLRILSKQRVDSGTRVDFEAICRELRAQAPNEDTLFLERLDEISQWDSLYGKGAKTEKAFNTQREAFLYMSVARGVRNWVNHLGGGRYVPSTHYGLVLWLARFAMQAYGAYVRRAARGMELANSGI